MQYYKLFYTDQELPAGSKPDFSFVLPLTFASIDEALLKAFKLMHGGAIVWKIEGPAGFHLDRAEIQRQYATFRTS